MSPAGERFDLGHWEMVGDDHEACWAYPCGCGATIRATGNGSIWDHWQHGDDPRVLQLRGDEPYPRARLDWIARIHGKKGEG